MRRLAVFVVLIAVGFAAGFGTQRFLNARQVPASSALAAAVVAPLAVRTPQFDAEPLWAYGVDTLPKPGDTAQPQTPPTRNLRKNEDAAEQTKLRHVAGSQAAYSLVDVRDSSHVIDWFPGDHPPMPSVVQLGSPVLGPLARGCASCHLPNGKGRPENAPVAGLPAAYFLRQMQDFRNGLRHTADPRKPNTPTMISLAIAMTDDELVAAAKYFGAIKYDTPWIRVVESDMVPKTKIVGNLFLPTEKALSEPIAGRLIEVPENEEQSELLRNPRSGFLAYVPKGSLERGRDLVTTGGLRVDGPTVTPGKTTACITCHGPNLLGIADVPPIAGRSPSYLVRQLWDMQQGTRAGTAASLMKTVVAQLNADDLVAIAAYVASRPVK